MTLPSLAILELPAVGIPENVSQLAASYSFFFRKCRWLMTNSLIGKINHKTPKNLRLGKVNFINSGHIRFSSSARPCALGDADGG